MLWAMKRGREDRSSGWEAKPGDWKRSFLRSVLFFDRQKLNGPAAIRNTAGLVLPLIGGYLLGMPRGGLAVASGALNVSYSDGSDPYASRAKRMITAALWCSVAVFFGAISGRSHTAAVAVLTVWAFVAGLLTCLGTAAADLGVISVVTLVVYSAQYLSPLEASQSALLALAGGALETSLSVALWPIYRHGPERRALAAFYAELAQIPSMPARAGEAPPATEAGVKAHQALSEFSGGGLAEGVRFITLLTQAERLRLSLTTLGRLRGRLERHSPEHAAIETISRFLENAAKVLRDLAAFLADNGATLKGQRDRLTYSVALAYQLGDHAGEAGSFTAAVVRSARHQMDAISGQLRTVCDIATRTTPSGAAEFEKQEARQPWWMRFNSTLGILRGNLNLRSAAFRHALRLAVCAAVGDTLGRLLESDRSYWIPMTIVIVLKPEFTVTFTRGILRIVGTIAGLLLATLLFHFLPIQTASEIALIGLFMLLMRWVGPANYGVFAVCVSALVVLLLAITGVSPTRVIHARGMNTIIGGMMALAAYALWPTWERTRIAELFGNLVGAYGQSFRAITRELLEPGAITHKKRDLARQNARTARSNLEASIDRLRAEPGTTKAQLERWTAMLATSHRLAHAMMAMEAGLLRRTGTAPRPEFSFFSGEVEKTLLLLQRALQDQRIPEKAFPDLREAHNRLVQASSGQDDRYALVNVETDRIVNSTNTLRELIFDMQRSTALKPEVATTAVPT
jgi:uncharacterized membrane protein YccC